MADNGGGRGRKTRKVTKPKKPLGKAALRSILKNEQTAEEFLSGLRDGTLPSQFGLGHVTRALGGGRFLVTFRDDEVQAALAGTISGRGGFWHNPEATTAVRVGSWVVVEDLGMGHMARGRHHEILAVLDSGQAAAARRMIGVRSASSNDDGIVDGFEFNRSSEERRAANLRAAQMASVARAMTSFRGMAGLAAAALEAGEEAAAAISPKSSSSNLNLNALLGKNAATKKAEAARARTQRRKAAKRATAGGGGGGGR